jgi:oligoribonuclease (3'-5' exoribonuclease)
MDDIYESIKELKYYRKNFLRLHWLFDNQY